MTNSETAGALDARLAASAPRAVADDAALHDAIGAVVREARDVSGRRRGPSWLTRGVAITAGAVLLAGAGTAAAVYYSSDSWLNPNAEFQARSDAIEWLATLPSGETCVYRIWATDLTHEQLEATRERMRDPQALIEADGGAVRERFLGELAIEGVDMNAILDQAYAQVALIDIDAGRGDIEETQLGNVPSSAESEVFNHSYMNIVLEGIGKPLSTPEFDGMSYFTPDRACVVNP